MCYSLEISSSFSNWFVAFKLVVCVCSKFLHEFAAFMEDFALLEELLQLFVVILDSVF